MAPSSKDRLHYLQGRAGTTTSDVANATAFPCPVHLAPGSAYVMELIRFIAWMPAFPVAVNANLRSIQVNLSVFNYGATPAVLDDPMVMAAAGNIEHAVVDGRYSYRQVTSYDMTDGAGNGLLFGNNQIWVQVYTANFGVTTSVRWKLLYRMVKISMLEYTQLTTPHG